MDLFFVTMSVIASGYLIITGDYYIRRHASFQAEFHNNSMEQGKIISLQ